MTFIGLFFWVLVRHSGVAKRIMLTIKRRDGRAIGSLRLVDEEAGKVIILRHC